MQGSRSQSPAGSQIVRSDLVHCRVKQSLQTPQRPRLEPESRVTPHLVDEVDFCSHVDAHSDDSPDRRVHTWRRTEKS